MDIIWEDWLFVAKYWILKDTSSCVSWSHTLHSPRRHQQNDMKRALLLILLMLMQHNSIIIPIWERKLRHGKSKHLMEAHSCICSKNTPVLQTAASQSSDTSLR